MRHALVPSKTRSVIGSPAFAIGSKAPQSQFIPCSITSLTGPHSSYIHSACATRPLDSLPFSPALHSNRDHASRPDRVCTPAVKLHAMQRASRYTTPQHPEIGQKLTVDERSHVSDHRWNSLAVVCPLACGTANASGD